MRTLADWLQLHESVHPRSIDLGLTRVARVARTLGLDRPACAVITVGGTNGKGSVAAHLEALLLALGARPGLFTSPHFLRYNERIRVGGREVSDAELIAAFEALEPARADTTLTFFEYNTLAALMIFARRAVDVAVLEVGLGGRLDATNLVDADVAVLASVGLDHRDWLGETLELIGAEKAGILRAGRPAVLGTAQMPASVFDAVRTLAARPLVAGRDFRWQVSAGRWDYQGVGSTLRALPPSSLAGSIQYRNAATALAALETLRSDGGARAAVRSALARLGPLDERTAAAALEHVRLAGRFQIVPGDVGTFGYAGHLGVHIRSLDDSPTPGSPQGSELLFGLAAGPRFDVGSAMTLVVGPELFGETAFRSFFGGSGTGVEALLSGRLEGTKEKGPKMRLKVGVGGGLDARFGAPEWRAAFAVELFDRQPSR